MLVGVSDLTPNRVCRTPKYVLPSGAKLILIRRKLGRAHDVEPVRVHLLKVIPGIHHDEAVNIQRRFGLLRLCIGRIAGLRANRLAGECQDKKKDSIPRIFLMTLFIQNNLLN